jgi:DUF1680 family protein
MIGGKVNGCFSVLLYENGVASTTVRDPKGEEVSLVVKSDTRFPAVGVVDFEVEPAKAADLTIDFRVPEWAENFRAVIGGERYAGRKGGMLAVRRRWKAGDRVEVRFEMPVEALPGGLSYPNAVAIKRGPQVLAIDKGLNLAIDSAGEVNYTGSLQLSDADATLPADWGWKEAFYLDAVVNGGRRRVVMVPFAEAGQKSDAVEVWIERRN